MRKIATRLLQQIVDIVERFNGLRADAALDGLSFSSTPTWPESSSLRPPSTIIAWLKPY